MCQLIFPSKDVGLFTWTLGGGVTLLRSGFDRFRGFCRWIGGTNGGVDVGVAGDFTPDIPGTPELPDPTTTGT